MNKENVILGFAVGFLVLSAVSLFTEISTQILAVLSLSSLLFAAAQIFENNLAITSEERKMQLDELNQNKELDLDAETILFLKKYHQELFPTKKAKADQIIAKALECASIIILVVGLTVPLQMFNNESISRASTIGAFGFVFLNMWQMEKSRKKFQDLEYIQLFREESQKAGFSLSEIGGEDDHDGQA